MVNNSRKYNQILKRFKTLLDKLELDEYKNDSMQSVTSKPVDERKVNEFYRYK